ncbi:methyltransferase domain-containing protein [Streptomyces sp. TRM66268-LWL]|uniref:Methyltransferase domain-containing protein n=1 Tax=Streptomyces polyasparticus TaxID=2767826 RepID=A0ABR7SBF5_9ACTN|nr:class I SAM-dependent methyltransferase [Streptomyces polyasparticus]MBC9712489.1 methyltransferase domain-containing protein [Streptomyces polyasparticus]
MANPAGTNTAGTNTAGTAEIVNVHQSEAWNGYEGEHWAAHHDRYNAINSGFNEALLDAAGIGTASRVLDIGCGAGQTTRLAARRAHEGTALGVDLSAPMLGRARAVAAEEGVGNVRFEQGDVQVFPFGEGTFDAAISRFAVMFFADPVAAFAHVARALRPGGRLAFVSMPDLGGTDLGTVMAAAAPHLPGWQAASAPDSGEPGAHGSGPLSLSDPGHVRSVLGAAGFRDISVRRIEAEEIWGSDAADAAEFFTGWGPVRFHLEGADPEPLRTALTAAFRRFERAGAVRLDGAAWLTEAVR